MPLAAEIRRGPGWILRMQIPSGLHEHAVGGWLAPSRPEVVKRVRYETAARSSLLNY
jgi:hypothetical protein